MQNQAFVFTAGPAAVPDEPTATRLYPSSRVLRFRFDYSTAAAPASASIVLWLNGVIDYTLPIPPTWIMDGALHEVLLPGLGPAVAQGPGTVDYRVQWVTTGGAGGAVYFCTDS
jgi:hypothetical protein